MAIPQRDIDRSRMQASFHVQVELVKQPNKRVSTGPVPIRARVVRVSRGQDSIHPGDPVTFDLNVCAPGDVPPPGPAYANYEALVHSSHMELFLNGPPDCELVEEGWTMLSNTTGEPVLCAQPDDGLERPRPERSDRSGWRFWS